MTNRYDIEGELVRLTGQLYESAVGGIDERSMKRLRPLLHDLNRVMGQAEALRPRLICVDDPPLPHQYAEN